MGNWMQLTIFFTVLSIFVATAYITLLGVIGKIQVKPSYLNLLLGSLIIEVSGAVLFMFKRIDVNDVSVDKYIRALPKEVQAKNENGKVTKISVHYAIRNIVLKNKRIANGYNICEKGLGLAQVENKDLKNSIKDLESSVTVYSFKYNDIKDNFLVKLVTFHKKASDFGRSLNFTKPYDTRKKALAKNMLELLTDLRHYKGTISNNPAVAKKALKKYNAKHGFAQVNWYSVNTFNTMVSDYMGFKNNKRNALLNQ